MQRVPVVDKDGQPLMPTTPARARKWVESGKAIKRWSDCGQFYVQLTGSPSGRKTQDIVIGVDPGKLYSGIGVQSAKVTLYREIRYEYVRADVDLTSGRKKARSGKGFSVVMVGQKWMLKQLEQFAVVFPVEGYQTAAIRKYLGLTKNKADKSQPEFSTHAVDAVSIASTTFVEYRQYHTTKVDGGDWFGCVSITPAVFRVIRRPPCSRRQLHLMVPAKGGVRRQYGGSTTRHALRKGDLVTSPKGIGYVSGDTEKQISVSDANWKRLGQIASRKVRLIRRSNGLIVA